MDIRLLYSTHPSLEQARTTASALLDAKQVACCNILSGVESHYHWQGTHTMANEVVLISKTTASLASAAREHIVKIHPHDCPAVLEIPVENGHFPFLQWISDQTMQSCD